MFTMQTRRQFLTTLSSASAASLVRAPPVLAAEGALETTTIRLHKPQPSICTAPVLVADDLLRAEGSTDVRYVSLPLTASRPDAVARGEIDFTMNFATTLATAIDRGVAITCWPGCMSVVSNYSGMKASVAFRSQGQDRRDNRAEEPCSSSRGVAV